jgi:antirestriction protein ArdC
MSNYRNKKNTRQYKGSPDGKSAGDRAADKFSTMMIESLKRMKASDWKQGWVGSNGHTRGLPQNVQGRVYNGTNSFFLQMDTAMHGYKMPVYMTYLNISKEGAHVLKGAVSMPVIYWDLSIKDEHGHRVAIEDFRKMSQAEQQKMDIHPFLKAYNVFNLDQTNYAEVHKEKYDQIVARFQGIQLRDEKGMYENPALDKMLKEQTWICPIQYDKLEEGAYYSPREDKVVIPTKAQFNISPTKDGIFKDGMEYYSNLLARVQPQYRPACPPRDRRSFRRCQVCQGRACRRAQCCPCRQRHRL